MHATFASVMINNKAMPTFYSTHSSKFETNRKNSEVIANLVAERNGGNEESRHSLIDILCMIREECHSGMSSEVALTLLEKDFRFREGELFISRKQAWSLGCGCTALGINLSAEIAETAADVKMEEEIDMPETKSQFTVEPAPAPVIPSFIPDFVNGARLGDTIELVDTETGNVLTFKIQRKASTSSSETGVVSSCSPVGAAILGHVAEDLVEVNTPSGKKQFQLLSVQGHKLHSNT